jgi:hypothetical protein
LPRKPRILVDSRRRERIPKEPGAAVMMWMAARVGKRERERLMRYVGGLSALVLNVMGYRTGAHLPEQKTPEMGNREDVAAVILS